MSEGASALRGCVPEDACQCKVNCAMLTCNAIRLAVITVVSNYQLERHSSCMLAKNIVTARASMIIWG